jgi:putative type-1 restriction enzyme hindVIIP specificity protein
METIRFDDFIRLNRGFDLPDYKIEKGEYPVITSTNIKAFHKEYKVEGPMVVTGRSGSLGKVQYIEGRCWPLNTSLYVKDYKGNFPRYVYYFLQMMHLEQYNAGAGVPTLNQNHLHSLKIKIHKKKLQQKIASILSSYDRLIENNTRRIRLLEQMAENLYKEWFVRFRFPEHENVEMVNGLPKGWEIKIIADFGRIETGKTPPMSNRDLYGGDILFVKTPDMHGKMFVRSTSETLSQEGNNYQRTKLLPINSIMVSCIGTAGVVSINTNLAHTNQQINSIILNNLEDLEWLYYACRQLKPTIELFGATGATMTNLSKGKFEKLKIVVPKVDFRGAFHKRIRPYFKEIYALEQQNTLLTRQRDLLLPRLMSGKLEVKS